MGRNALKEIEGDPLQTDRQTDRQKERKRRKKEKKRKRKENEKWWKEKGKEITRNIKAAVISSCDTGEGFASGS